jgi:adenylosuccinate synthase
VPPITIVQGAQYGSEAKGTIAGWLATTRHYDFAVRTGAINAGHTVYYKGKPYAMQQLPVAWVNPEVKLVIGPGAYVHLPTLNREVDMIREATGEDPFHRILIDQRACVHGEGCEEESALANRHHLIGATGKGCAEAVVHKIVDRGVRDLTMKRWHPEWNYTDTPEMLTKAYDEGASIMLEGTQGELLDFHLGPWPYVTSRQTTPAAWIAEAGLSPTLGYELVLVARTFPIRVAGNSGPLPGELTWPLLAREVNRKLNLRGLGEHPLRVSEEALVAFEDAVRTIGDSRGVALDRHHLWLQGTRVAYKDLLSEYSTKALEMISEGHQAELRKLFEFTTVTRKLRRVATFDRVEFDRVVSRLKPTWIALTFLNYYFPELHGATSLPGYAGSVARNLAPGVTVVNTGPLPEHTFEV